MVWSACVKTITLTYLYVLSRFTIPSMEAFFRHIAWHFSLWNTKLHKHFNASTDTSLLHSTLCVPILAIFNKQSNWSTVAWFKLHLFRLNIRTDAKHCGKIFGWTFGDFKMLKMLVQIMGHWPDWLNTLKSKVCECCQKKKVLWC